MTIHRLPILFLSFFALLFAVSAVLGVLPAYDASLSMTALTAILSSVALYFAVAYLLRSWLAVRIVSGLVIGISTLLALYFITQYGYQDYRETPALIQQFAAVTTIPLRLGDYTFHPNTVATMLEMIAPLAAAQAVSSRVPVRRVIWAICTLIILYAMLLTVSYRGWSALVVVALFALALYVLHQWPRPLAVTGILIVLVAAVGLTLLALGTDQLPFLNSILARLFNLGDLFSNSLYLAGDYGFTGIGLGGTFGMVYSRYSLLIFNPFITYPNNLLLAVWLNQGLPGVIAFVGIIVSFYTLVYRVTRHSTPRRLFHGAWLGITATLIHGIVDTRHYADSPWVMPVLFIVLGLTVAAGRMAAEDVGLLERPQPASWRPWVVLAVAVVLIAAGVYGRFSRQIMAAWYTNLGAIDEARAELAPGPGSMADQTSPDPLTQTILTEADRQTYYASAEAWYRRALETDPSYSNANRRLGNMLVTLNRYEQGVPLLETALATEPAYGATIKGLGLAYVWVGRIDDAVRTIALHDDPDSIAEELYTWGYFRDSQNRPLLAARAWATAQMMYPDSGDISVWLLIADTYRRADDLDSARRWYERVLEVEPDNRLARDGLEQVG